jgi:hypothetical protein
MYRNRKLNQRTRVGKIVFPALFQPKGNYAGSIFENEESDDQGIRQETWNNDCR